MEINMKYKLTKSVISVILIATLALMLASASNAAPWRTASGTAPDTQEAALIQDKSEVIYATMGADGGVRNVYAVNHFEVAGAGSFTDYGHYSSITNLSTTDPLAQDGDCVSIQADEGDFYYQGNMSVTDLPWIFTLSYTLDGEIITPQELSGQSGKLEIHMKSAPNKNIDAVFYDYYMLQISLTLDTERCSDIKAPDATIAEAGKNKMMTYTVMPGTDADIVVSADVQDFVMAGIDISALPFSMSMELPDTSGLTDELGQLSDAISDLNDGVGELSGGVAELKEGAGELVNGSSGIGQGLFELNQNSGKLTEASELIDEALKQIASSLSDGMSGDIDLSGLTQLPQGLSQLAEGLRQISNGLTALKDGFTPAYQALNAAIQGIPDTVITENQIAELYANTDQSQYGLLSELIESYVAGQTVKGTYNQVKAAFDAVGSTIDTITANTNTIAGTLNDLAKEIEGALSSMDVLQQLDDLSAGLSELSQSYGEFHKGLKEYTDGVKQLNDGYTEFHSGISLFGDGMIDLKQGVNDLYDGTSEFKSETADIPEKTQAEIEKMMDEYLGSDFDPVSFTSSKNKNIGLVQFVFKCDGVEKVKEASIPAETKTESFWDRLTALFKGKEEE